MANIGLHTGADRMASRMARRERPWPSRISVVLMSELLMPALTDQHLRRQKISLTWGGFGG